MTGFDQNEARWPRLTEQVPPVSGVIKQRPEDFYVEEIPAYDPCDSGPHLFICVQKRRLSTLRAVREVARALGVRPRDVGLAGQKDARAVTRQVISVEGVEPGAALALDLPRIDVVWARRHRNKLRLGHHRGNRFRLRLREVGPGRIGDVRRVLEILHEQGAPNYFGQQRFGARGDTWRIGRALLAEEFDEAARLVAGSPGPHDEGEVRRARELFDEGRFEEARLAWPPGYDECARLGRMMERFYGDARRALLALDKRTLGLYVSAYQSWLFNHLVARRLDSLGALEAGDLAWKHVNGAVFLVQDPPAEQPRADRFEISPTGPLYGARMSRPGGDPGARESALLEAQGIGTGAFPRSGPFKVPGGRRPMRFRPEDVAVREGDDEHGPFVEVAFSLAPGCYATEVMREIGKDALREAD